MQSFSWGKAFDCISDMFIHGVMVSDLKHKCFQNCEVKTMIDNITMNGPKMVSLFSGCGGLDCGFMRAGFNVIWANDFDSDAQAVYRLNLGEIDGRDIMTVNADEIPDCDILTAGFPCQPFSSAGNRRGVHDSRGMLYKECLRSFINKVYRWSEFGGSYCIRPFNNERCRLQCCPPTY